MIQRGKKALASAATTATSFSNQFVDWVKGNATDAQVADVVAKKAELLTRTKLDKAVFEKDSLLDQMKKAMVAKDDEKVAELVCAYKANQPNLFYRMVYGFTNYLKKGAQYAKRTLNVVSFGTVFKTIKDEMKDDSEKAENESTIVNLANIIAAQALVDNPDLAKTIAKEQAKNKTNEETIATATRDLHAHVGKLLRSGLVKLDEEKETLKDAINADEKNKETKPTLSDEVTKAAQTPATPVV